MNIKPRHGWILLAALGLAQPTLSQAPKPVLPNRPADVNADMRLTAEAMPSESSALYQYYTETPPAALQPVHFDGGDPTGPMRMAQPTPVGGYGFADGPNVAHDMRPDSRTVGIRLDTSYRLWREFELGAYLSEHQATIAGGVTLLPLQTPCVILGTRAMVGYMDNMSMWSTHESYHLDVYAGTRYKSLYAKFGAFLDTQDTWGKWGFTVSTLSNLGPFKNVTFDAALGWQVGRDQFKPSVGTTSPNSTRVEVSNYDLQFRFGKFLARDFQVGVVSNFYDWDFVESEWGVGTFANMYLGCTQIGLEVSGGKEGLRGMLTFGMNWGGKPWDNPQDCYHWPVDTVSWVTQATRRDISIRLRESVTGPPPAQ